MSYDLYFYAKQGATVPSVDDLKSYFKELKYFELKEDSAIYSNEDTGVYFGFDFSNDMDDDFPESVQAKNMLPVTFNINYYRPHVFGLEAEPVVSAFIRHFNLLVIDYQIEGMGEGEYSSQGFLKGWNLGNETAYSGLIQNEKQIPFSLPSKQIEDYWKWNCHIEEFQNELGDNIFVPRIMFIILEGTAEPVVVWTDGIPVVLPVLNTYLIYRQKTTHGLFGKKASFALVNKQQLYPLLSHYEILNRHLPYHFLKYQSTPQEIDSFVKSLPPYKVELQGIGLDHLLNKEIIDNIKPNKS